MTSVGTRGWDRAFQAGSSHDYWYDGRVGFLQVTAIAAAGKEIITEALPLAGGEVDKP
jgi:hypothetical protein